ncbi:prepilin peptidase [Streptomyces sp. NPDC016845]|uniref:prepilin peptidase n=1 Tax=Streptomyces sp. NPDC016845 TaxID=3364972 RepID=UPI003798BF95
MPILIVATALWGGASGWCILAALHRLAVPAGDPWRTTCPHGHPLPNHLWGWLAPWCAAGGHRYPSTARAGSIPAAVISVCGLLAFTTGPHPELVVWLLLTPAGTLLALVDARTHRLPDVLTLPLAAVALALLGAASLLPGAAGAWTGALLGALTLTTLFLIVFLASPRTLGFGDVKLAPALGTVLGWYGWPLLLLGLFIGCLLAAAHGLLLIARREATARTALPFGPPLLLGALLAIAADRLLF